MSVDTSDVPTIDYEVLAAKLASTSDKKQYKAIVEAPFANKLDMAFLFLGFICMYIVDEEKSEIQLVGASGTEEYSLAVEHYNFNPSNFRLHFDTDKDNTIVQAIASGKPKDTTDWATLSRKHKSLEVVRFNQANSGIAYTAIYPFSSSVRGCIMYNFYQYPDQINGDQRRFMKKYTALVSAHLSAETKS